jgi:hypothetical protein
MYAVCNGQINISSSLIILNYLLQVSGLGEHKLCGSNHHFKIEVLEGVLKIF